jgi:hypothetical protein
MMMHYHELPNQGWHLSGASGAVNQKHNRKMGSSFGGILTIKSGQRWSE